MISIDKGYSSEKRYRSEELTMLMAGLGFGI